MKYSACILGVCTIIASQAVLPAADFTWGGGGFNNNWSQSGNWGGTAPPNTGTADLIFSGSNRPSPNADAAWHLNTLTFSSTSTSFTIGGQTLTFSTHGTLPPVTPLIINSSSNAHTINNSLVFNDNGTLNASTGNLTFGGTSISNSGNTLTLTAATGRTLTFNAILTGLGPVVKNGAGTATVNSTAIYTGSTTISGGVLELAGALNNSETITLSSGTLRLLDNERIHNSAALTMSSGTTFNLNGFTETIGVLSGAGGIQLGTDGALSVNNAGTQTYSGVISGSGGSLTLRGLGTLVLSGNNTYSGTTTIDGGTLRLGASNRISDSSAVVMGSGVTFDLNENSETIASFAGAGIVLLSSDVANPGALTMGGDNSSTLFSGSLSGFGSVTKNGVGTFTLTGSSASNVALTVNNGTLQIGNGGSTGSVSGNITNNAVVTFNRTGSLSYSGTISGAGDLNKDGTGTLTLNAANAGTGNTTVKGGTLQYGIANAIHSSSAVEVQTGATLNLNGHTSTVGSLTGNGTVNLGTASLTMGGSGATTIFNGSMSSTGGSVLTKTGAGIFSLSGSLTNLGSISLTGGTITLAGSERISNTTALAMSSGTTFNVNGQTETLGTLTGAGSIALGSGGSLIVTQGAAGTYSGVISGTTGTFTKAGDQTLTLSGSNTYTGSTIVSAGTLRLGASHRISNSSALVMSGGSLDLDGFSETVASLEGSGVVFLSSNPLSPGALTFGGTASTAYSGGVAGHGSIIKNGIGTFTLTGATTSTVGITINNGTFQVGNGGVSGEVEGNITNLSALVFNRSDAVSYGGQISGGGSILKDGAGVLTFSAPQAMTGSTTIAAGVIRYGVNDSLASGTAVNVQTDGTLDLDGRSGSIGSLTGLGAVSLGAGHLTMGGSGATTVFAGTMSGAFGSTLTKTGAGTFSLSGTIDVPTILLSAGTFTLSGSERIGNINAVDVSAGAVLNVNGQTETIGRLSGAGSITLGSGGALTTNAGSATLFSGIISDEGISGPGSFAKTGVGTLEITGANTYRGDTLITQGTLKLGSGSVLSDNTAVVVGSSGTLDVNGVTEQVHRLAGTGTVALGGGTLIVGGMSGILEADFSGSLTETGVFRKSGAVAQTLSGSAAATVTLEVGQGSLIITGTPASAVINVNGGSLNLPVGERLSDTASVFVNSSATLALTGTSQTETIGLLTGNGTVNLGTNTLRFGTDQDFSFDGRFVDSLTGSGTIMKRGNGTMLWNAVLPSAHDGETRVDGGIIRLGGSDILSDQSRLVMASDAQLDLDRHSDTVGSLGGSGIIDLGSSPLGLPPLATLTFGADNTDASSTVRVIGDGNLVKTGSGRQTLHAVLDFDGAIEVLSGTLVLPNSLSLGAGVKLDISGAGGVVEFQGGGQEFDGLAGEGTLHFGDNLNSYITLDSDFDRTFSGTITGSMSYLRKRGTGTQFLFGDNSFTGDVYLDEGTLDLGGAGGTINRLPDTGSIIISAGATLRVSQGRETIGSLSGAGTIQMNSIVNGSWVRANQTTNTTFSGLLTGNMQFIKDGPAELTLTNPDNDYSEGTRVMAGRLNGTLSSIRGDIEVDQGAVAWIDLPNAFINLNPDRSFLGQGTVRLAGKTLGRFDVLPSQLQGRRVIMEDGRLQLSEPGVTPSIIQLNSGAKLVLPDVDAHDPPVVIGGLHGVGGIVNLSERLVLDVGPDQEGTTLIYGGGINDSESNGYRVRPYTGESHLHIDPPNSYTEWEVEFILLPYGQFGVGTLVRISSIPGSTIPPGLNPDYDYYVVESEPFSGRNRISRTPNGPPVRIRIEHLDQFDPEWDFNFHPYSIQNDVGHLVKRGPGTQYLIGNQPGFLKMYAGNTIVEDGRLGILGNDVLPIWTELHVYGNGILDIGNSYQEVAHVSGNGTLHLGDVSGGTLLVNHNRSHEPGFLPFQGAITGRGSLLFQGRTDSDTLDLTNASVSYEGTTQIIKGGIISNNPGHPDSTIMLENEQTRLVLIGQNEFTIRTVVGWGRLDASGGTIRMTNPYTEFYGQLIADTIPMDNQELRLYGYIHQSPEINGHKFTSARYILRNGSRVLMNMDTAGGTFDMEEGTEVHISHNHLVPGGGSSNRDVIGASALGTGDFRVDMHSDMIRDFGGQFSDFTGRLYFGGRFNLLGGPRFVLGGTLMSAGNMTLKAHLEVHALPENGSVGTIHLNGASFTHTGDSNVYGGTQFISDISEEPDLVDLVQKGAGTLRFSGYSGHGWVRAENGIIELPAPAHPHSVHVDDGALIRVETATLNGQINLRALGGAGVLEIPGITDLTVGSGDVSFPFPSSLDIQTGSTDLLLRKTGDSTLTFSARPLRTITQLRLEQGELQLPAEDAIAEPGTLDLSLAGGTVAHVHANQRLGAFRHASVQDVSGTGTARLYDDVILEISGLPGGVGSGARLEDHGANTLLRLSSGRSHSFDHVGADLIHVMAGTTLSINGGIDTPVMQLDASTLIWRRDTEPESGTRGIQELRLNGNSTISFMDGVGDIYLRPQQGRTPLLVDGVTTITGDTTSVAYLGAVTGTAGSEVRVHGYWANFSHRPSNNVLLKAISGGRVELNSHGGGLPSRLEASFGGYIRLSFSGVDQSLITGSGYLELNPTGTLRLDGVPDFTGSVYLRQGVWDATNLPGWYSKQENMNILEGGEMRLPAGEWKSILRITEAVGDAALHVAAGQTTLIGSLSGVQNFSTLRKTGAGVLEVRAPFSFSGSLHVAEGVLETSTGHFSSGPFDDLVVDASLILEQTEDLGPGLFMGSFSGTGTVTKSGAGSLHLVNSQTHAGGTQILAGTLRLDAPHSGPMSAAVGSVLSGTGSLNGGLALHGTLAPGGSVGSMQASAATFGTGAAYEWEIGQWSGAPGSGHDVLQTGTLVIQSTQAAPMVIRVKSLSLTGFVDLAASFPIVRTTGSITGFDAAAFVVDSSAFSAGNGIWRVAQSGNDLVLNYIPQLDSWLTNQGLSGNDALHSADPDMDGLANILEFVLGKMPNDSNRGEMPAAEPKNVDGVDYLEFVYQRAKAAAHLNPYVEYGTSLQSWTTAVHGENGVIILEQELNTSFDTVTVRIPRPEGSPMFARLAVNLPGS